MHAIRRRARAAASNDDGIFNGQSLFNPYAHRRAPQPDVLSSEERGDGIHLTKIATSDEIPENFSVGREKHSELFTNIDSKGNENESESAGEPPEADEHKSKGPQQKFWNPDTIVRELRVIFLNSWLHVFLLFIPAGFAVNYCHVSAPVNFALNFVAVIPAAMVLGLGVDDLSLRTGDTVGALLDVTFSNAVQLITSIFLLRDRQIIVLRTSLVGSMLSNLLLMAGLGFFVGGVRRIEQAFSYSVASLLGFLLLLAFTSLMIPTASSFVMHTTEVDLWKQSCGSAVVLLVGYGMFLIFQLKTHAPMFNQPTPGRRRERSDKWRKHTARKRPGWASDEEDHDDDEAEQPQLSFYTAITTVLVSTTILAFNTQFAMNSIEGVLQSTGLTPTFLGLVIIPILSSNPLTIVVAYYDKMDLSISLTIGRCMQTALLVIPVTVIIGWGMDIREMTLKFSEFEVSVLFAAVLVVNYLVMDGKSNWLQGALLVEVYVIIAIAAYFVP